MSAKKLSRRVRKPIDRKSTRLNSSHTVIYTLSLHDALPILPAPRAEVYAALIDPAVIQEVIDVCEKIVQTGEETYRSEEHTSELQSHSDLHSFPTRRSSDLARAARRGLCGSHRSGCDSGGD